jgi:uncharacterized protein with PIN domain
MSDDYKIYIDTGQPATFNNGAFRLIAPHCKKLYWPGTDWRLSRRHERAAQSYAPYRPV